MEHVSALQGLLLGLLAAVAIIAALAKRLSISYPILLVVVGLVCSLLPHVPRVPLSPNMVLYVLLPPLLYAAAWQTSWREFRYSLVSIILLAVGLVFFTAVGVALTVSFFLPGFDWRLGFLLGAIVSPTDAVAASSIARRLHMPPSILQLLEGESLVNDATGLLALQFGLDMIVNGASPALGPATLQFAWLLIGGIGIGLLSAVVAEWLERWIEEGPTEIAFSIIVAYASYLAGDEAHASGVISVVVCGLFLSRRSSRLFSPQSRLQIMSVWDALEFLLNGLVFLLIGLQLPDVLAGIRGYSLLRLSMYGLAFSGVLIGLRLLWMYPGTQIAYVIRTRFLHQHYKKPERRAMFVVGWTGMRGVVALAAAGSLPYTIGDGRPFPQRNLIVFLTFAVILVTLVLQGLTLPGVIRALGFGVNTQPQCEEDEARLLLLQTAIDHLKDERSKVEESAQAPYDDILSRLEFSRDELTSRENGAAQDAESRVDTRSLLIDMYRRQRNTLDDLRHEGRVGDGAYRTLERELDLGESRLLSQKGA